MTARRRKLVRFGKWSVGVLVALLLAGLGGPYLACNVTANLAATTQPSAGHVIHVVGWDGPLAGDRAFLNALREGGCRHSMEAFDWTADRRGLMALWRAQNDSEPPRLLAARIVQLACEDPSRPIDLTADSSGCGVALAALAMLPDDVSVERVILSSPAVSRGYDLGPALKHVRRSIVSFNSDEDDLIFLIGTTLFGTTDGHHAAAAGRDGFLVPAGRPAYAKLEQVSYDPAWKAVYGHNGSHAQALTPRFAKAKVAPKLLAADTSSVGR